MQLKLKPQAIIDLCRERVPSGPLVLGLSGGGDSTALLSLLVETARSTGQSVHALIVDHHLRPESTDEAHQTAKRAEDLGAQAHILNWTEPKPGQNAARLGRHRLLAETTRQLGASILFLGHTLDDRIETYVMRTARTGSSPERSVMTDISPSPVWPEGRGLKIVRPLLGLRRHELRDYLDQTGLSWIDDPSNEDDRYERIKVRQAISQGVLTDLPAVDKLDELAGQASVRLATAGQMLRRSGSFQDWGGLKFRPGMSWGDDEETLCRVMELAILAVSGQQDLPGKDLTTRFVDALSNRSPITGAGAALTGQGWLGRDPGAVTGRRDGASGLESVTLSAGESTVWDGRFEIHAKHSVQIEVADESISARLYPQLPEMFRRTLPVLRFEAGEPTSLFNNDGIQVESLTLSRVSHLLSTVE